MMKPSVSFVKIGQHNIRYLEAGNSKKTIVLLHGLGASAERWLPIMPYLSSRYRVIVPDIIGFGYSDKPVTNYTIKFFMEFLSNFLDQLSIEKTTMVGSSLGGRILIDYAIYHQNIEKIVLVSPAINDESSPALQSYIQAALHPAFEDVKKAFAMISGENDKVDDEIITEFINRMNLPNSKMAFLASLIGLKKEIITQEKLAKLVTPTLLVWGKEDQVIPISNADKFNGFVKNFQYHIMDGCGHVPFAEKPELFSKIVLNFLSD